MVAKKCIICVRKRRTRVRAHAHDVCVYVYIKGYMSSCATDESSTALPRNDSRAKFRKISNSQLWIGLRRWRSENNNRFRERETRVIWSRNHIPAAFASSISRIVFVHALVYTKPMSGLKRLRIRLSNFNNRTFPSSVRRVFNDSACRRTKNTSYCYYVFPTNIYCPPSRMDTRFFGYFHDVHVC